MTREEKDQIIAELSEALQSHMGFYVLNLEGLNAEETIAFRRACYEKGFRIRVVKNTLLEKALERAGISVEPLGAAFRLQSAVVFVEKNPKELAQVLKSYREKANKDRPSFKAAYIADSVYSGEEQLEALLRYKTKEELLGELIARLHSPIQTVLGVLQGAAGQLHGILKTIGERNS